jgi:hypothetical protein
MERIVEDDMIPYDWEEVHISQFVLQRDGNRFFMDVLFFDNGYVIPYLHDDIPITDEERLCIAETCELLSPPKSKDYIDPCGHYHILPICINRLPSIKEMPHANWSLFADVVFGDEDVVFDYARPYQFDDDVRKVTGTPCVAGIVSLYGRESYWAVPAPLCVESLCLLYAYWSYGGTCWSY